MQMNDPNKLPTKTKEQSKRKNEQTKEHVAASLFNSNLFRSVLLVRKQAESVRKGWFSATAPAQKHATDDPVYTALF